MHCLPCTQPFYPAHDLANGPSSLSSNAAPSCLGSYRGCLTSIFIFCFGVRSPCRMTAITQRSSILGKQKIQCTDVTVHTRTVTRGLFPIVLSVPTQQLENAVLLGDICPLDSFCLGHLRRRQVLTWCQKSWGQWEYLLLLLGWTREYETEEPIPA